MGHTNSEVHATKPTNNPNPTPNSNPNPNPTQDHNVSHEEFISLLKERLEYWQSILGLRDWNVHLRVARYGEVDSDDAEAIASTTIYATRRDAFMTVLSPTDLPLLKDLSDNEHNYDVTLIHELLHLHFAPFQADEDTPLGLAQEQVIEAISRGMVKVDSTKEVAPLHMTTSNTPSNSHWGYL